MPQPSALVLAFALVLAACNDESVSSKPPTLVRTETVRVQDRQASVTLTGDVQARINAELSFRVSGRVTERLVDVGAHVSAGDVLARIDPTEQQADLDAATAAVSAAESQLHVASATFERQKTLLSSGFTTRSSFDQAEEGLRTAEGSLDAAKAQLGMSRDALSYLFKTALGTTSQGNSILKSNFKKIILAALSFFEFSHSLGPQLPTCGAASSRQLSGVQRPWR
jgi:multidrug efflux pump subunit AcrA (membrane-fusion protein)